MKSATWPRVVAIVPARNEELTIARTVASLAAQDYKGEFSIVIVDDHSTDATASLARRAADEQSGRHKIVIHNASDLADGWTGKLWAQNEGIRMASAESPDYLWFTDADIVHARDTLSRLVVRAQADSLDLYSLMVLLQAKTFPERFLIPPFLYFFLMLYPPTWTEQSENRTAGAAGGCILLRRSALETIGGLAEIRSEVIDDCALAREVKRNGGRLKMCLSRSSISLREYGTFAEIRDMIARTAFTQLRYSAVILLGTLAGLLLTYIAPIVGLFSQDVLVRGMGLAAWVLMTVTFLPTVRFFKLTPLWAPFLPLAALFYLYATWISAMRFWLGRGGQWKGRAQAPKQA